MLVTIGSSGQVIRIDERLEKKNVDSDLNVGYTVVQFVVDPQ